MIGSNPMGQACSTTSSRTSGVIYGSDGKETGAQERPGGKAGGGQRGVAGDGRRWAAHREGGRQAWRQGRQVNRQGGGEEGDHRGSTGRCRRRLPGAPEPEEEGQTV